MPYKTNKDLPDAVKNHLPSHAQDIFRESYNHALSQYKKPEKRRGNESQEEVANKVAWSAVKTKYTKKDDKWVSK